jgi:hypothetical protein
MIPNNKIFIYIFISLFLLGCAPNSALLNSKTNSVNKTASPSDTTLTKDVCNNQLGEKKLISRSEEQKCFGKYETDPLNYIFSKNTLPPPCNTKTHPYTWDKCFGRISDGMGREFEGEFLNGKRSGVGRYVDLQKVFVGYWENDLPNGVGVFKNLWFDQIRYTTKVVKGRWENGTLMQVYLQNFDFNEDLNFFIDQKNYRVFDSVEDENKKLYRKYEDIECMGDALEQWNFCKKEVNFDNGEKYSGQWKNGKFDGYGTYRYKDGTLFKGEWKLGKKNGFGSVKDKGSGLQIAQYWDMGVEISQEQFLQKIGKQAKKYSLSTTSIKNDERFQIVVKNTKPNEDGSFLIIIENSKEIASLKINDESQAISNSNLLEIKKFAKAGQETVFTIFATDINGNADTKTITVNRPVVESQAKFTPLNPAQIRKQAQRDAVAIIIGIADYKNLPRADFANDDASVFYDYAIRALGINAENIKLLVDANADDVAIYQAFKTWLPSRVRATTDVYVYYSGHGLPAEDGKGLYLMPQRAHRDLIEKTAISQQEINGFIQAARPSSVTIFLDSCYSGLARSGETLLASARPVVLKSDKNLFPNNFTVITASQADQISSSSPDLKHGIFSYYLMKGMEGEADADRDGRITLGEMQGYLVDNVGRHAGVMNRKQEPQLIGDPNRVLVGR